MVTRPGDEVGAAGRMLLAGRELAAHPAEPVTTRRSATWPDELRQLSAAAW
ncbi:hypothetical protein NKH98_31315 [Mesorhizobium sp. M0833]